MNDKGKYIYGVIDDEPPKGAPGILMPDGIYAIPYRDIFAVAGDAEMVDYAGLPGDAAVRYLVRHQTVIEKVMKDYTIIPMKPGMWVQNEDEVVSVLNTGYHKFKETLDKIRGRIELDITATWIDLNAVIKEVSGENEVMRLKQALLEKDGGITMEDRMKMGMLIEDRLNTRKKVCAATITETVRDCCRNMKEYPVADGPAIMSAAFFLDKDMRLPFEEKLEALNDRFEGKVHFKCIGPLPPYNFSMIEIRKFQYEDIDRARKTLALGDFATRDDVKKAYKKHAFLHHPDRLPHEEMAEDKYFEVTKAYELLSEYCQDGYGGFKKEDFAGKSIIAKIWEQ
jgi:hypothetical protein